MGARTCRFEVVDLLVEQGSRMEKRGRSLRQIVGWISGRGATPTRGTLVSEMLMMFRIASPQRTKIVLLGVGLVLVIAATAFGQIRLNAWNQPFYNAA